MVVDVVDVFPQRIVEAQAGMTHDNRRILCQIETLAESFYIRLGVTRWPVRLPQAVICEFLVQFPINFDIDDLVQACRRYRGAAWQATKCLE